MRPYFEKMQAFGKPVKENAANAEEIRKVEQAIAALVGEKRKAGLPAETLNKRGEWTVHQRLDYIIDKDTWAPLHMLYDPMEEESGTTGVVDGLGRINGRWCVVIGFDNKVMAGAWIAGQSDNILRVTDIAKRLHCPLVWLVNCSGVKLTEQEKVYANRRGNGTTFFRHAELNKLGIPVLAAIYGTNPAGGGYQGISPTLLLAHKDCNIAVGGAGIVSGMAPKGYFDEGMAEQIIDATRKFKSVPPGRVEIHYDNTGFFKQVFQTEESILDAVKEWVAYLPAYNNKFFRVAEAADPAFSAEDLYHVVAFNQKMTYDVYQFLSRLVDGSEHMEFRPEYGPELYTGLVKIDGFLIGVVANKQGMMPRGYPQYAPYPGIGGKFYREGLDQGERVRDALRQGQGPNGLGPGHDGHRRGRLCGKGRAAGSGTVAHLFNRTGERLSHDGDRAQEGHCRRPLHHGGAAGQQQQCLHPRHGDHRDLRHARRDCRGGELCETARQGERRGEIPRPGDRADEQDGQGVLREVEAGVLREDGARGRGGEDDGLKKVSRRFRQLLLSEPGVDLPAAPDDASEDHQGLKTKRERQGATYRVRATPTRAQRSAAGHLLQNGDRGVHVLLPCVTRSGL